MSILRRRGITRHQIWVLAMLFAIAGLAICIFELVHLHELARQLDLNPDAPRALQTAQHMYRCFGGVNVTLMAVTAWGVRRTEG